MIVDGWNYDFTDAPRSLSEEIIVVFRDRENAWVRHSATAPVLSVVWDSGQYGDNPETHEDSIGWTTGGCARWADEDLECWRPMPPKST